MTARLLNLQASGPLRGADAHARRLATVGRQEHDRDRQEERWANRSRARRATPAGSWRTSASAPRQSLGPVAQRQALEAWVRARGAELVAVHEDLGLSGGTELEKRPGLLAALDALRAHGAGVLLVAKRDRLARDPMVAAMVERLAERAGGAVVSAAGEGNGDAPADVLMRRMIDAFAEYERLIIRARTRAALAVKRSRGERTGDVPFGYRLAEDGVHLVELPEEQSVIREVRRLGEQDLTLRAICERLASMGLRPRSGAWHPQKIRRILQRGAPNACGDAAPLHA